MADDVQIEVYGIRHHGAGSSRNLLSALHHFQPHIILVECPADCQHLINYVDDQWLTPPVAIMVYNKKDLQQYAYYPFTIFSPEWQGIRFGLAHGAAVRFFDLPHSHSFLLSVSTTTTSREKGFIKDPFAYMATLAGYDDPELWWDTYIEHQNTAPEVFVLINDLMSELRSADATENHSNALREAFMRQQIRKARREGYKKIGIICGAWHAPALDLLKHTDKDDRTLLTKLKKVPIDCTWVPWSYNRIARHSGYSSGVISPYWYEALFTDPAQAVPRWMSRAASIMRDMGHDISPAHVIEGSNLAYALCQLRDRAWPGISDLFDVISSVYCGSDDKLIEQMKIKLLEGENVGLVSDEIPMVPLQKDIEDQVKKARLSKDWRQQGHIEKTLDLRKKTQLKASRLLNRLLLLGIPWGEEHEPDHNPLGNFQEHWSLLWYPDYEILIIEASMWGNTVQEAATNLILDQLRSEENFENLGIWLYQALHAHLPDLITPVSRKIRDIGNLTEDVHLLLQITPPLIWSTRYGDIAQLDTDSLHALLEQLFPRICVLLPLQVSSISEESSRSYFTAINKMHQAIQMVSDPALKAQWLSTIRSMALSSDADPLIKGNCLKIVLIKKQLPEERVFNIIRFDLSTLSDPFYPAYLLEGFLSGGGWLLIHHPTLRNIIDHWFLNLSEEDFMTYLPIIRRTFGTFHDDEKNAIFQLIFDGRSRQQNDRQLDDARKALVLPAVKKLI